MSISKERKIWKSSKAAAAAMVIGNEDAVMISHDNVIAVSEQGITLAGPISLATDAHNIRTGGLFVGLNDFLDMIPSTILTPTPKHIPFPPIHGVVGIAEDVSFFMSLLS